MTIENQSAPDLEQLQKDLVDLDLDGDLPEEFQVSEGGSNEEKEAKRAHAFNELRGHLKSAKGVIGQYAAEKKEREEKEKAVKPDQSQGNLAYQQAQYESNLRVRAMQSLGTLDANSPFVEREAQRLYALDMATREKEIVAVKEADGIVDETLSEFSQFTDEDKGAIRESMTSWSALDRANPDFVRREAHTFIGANFERFKPAPNGKPSKPQGVAPGAAAASTIKATGNKGVAPGDKGKQSGAPKPATSEEVKQMKAIGCPPDQIETFRAGQKKRGNYSPS